MSVPARLMIVEDEGIVALNLQQRLTRLGYDVTAIAASCDEAMEAAQRTAPDLCLMDIRIEGDADGIETAERLNRLRPTPVVYLTAHHEDSTLERARATRPYGYLLKPFSEREMHATIQMALARREAEAKTRAMEEALERRVEERTAELQRLNDEMRTFSHSVAHDLREPLRAISGLCHLLLDEGGNTLGASERLQVRRIRDAGERMERITEGLLSLARIGRQPLARAEVNLGEIAKGIARHLQGAEPQRVVAFEIGAELRARADRQLVEVLLTNLLGNAWKFSARVPEARIAVGRREDAPGAFFVRDNGAGFDMALAPQLFQPFHRLHPAGDFAGEGIGLATVRRIVERHGGRAWVEASPGQGCTVSFTLAPAEEPGR